MQISHNIQAMNTHRQMGITAGNQSKSMEKLSSGYRINRAGDDAAGLAVSEKMRAQIKGLNQASRNAQDGISMIQTFEGALGETHSILQRMRELTIQAANDTNIDADRNSIQEEIIQLKSEVDRIANNSEFNSKNMMNYGASLNAAGFEGISQDVINTLNQKIPGWINDGMVAINGQFGIDYPDSPVKRNLTVQYENSPSAGYAAAMATSDGGSTLTLKINLDSFTDSNGNLIDEQVLDGLLAHEVMHAFQYTEMSQLLSGGLSDEERWFMEGLAMTVQGGNSWIGAITGGIANADISGAFGGSTEEYASAFVAIKTLHEITTGGIGAVIDRLEAGDSLDLAIANTTQADQGEVTSTGDYNSGGNYTTFNQFLVDFNAGDFDNYLTGVTTDFTVGTGAITDAATAGSSSNLTLAQTIPNATGTSQVYTNFSLSYTADSATSTPNNTPKEVVLHIGANQGQSMTIAAFDATANGLGIDSVNASSQATADESITVIDNALKSVSDIRGRFGAYQNRLEHTISNLDNTAENLQAAESRIRDVDMAKEMMNFTKNNILQQAAQSMLAQANQAPQGVLQLLR